eukprot:scaffold124113_cov63-Phaeocystis_antarctica.AAC.6
MPDELRDGPVVLGLGVLQGCLAVLIEQLGVGVGSQQSLHARLFASSSGHHQSGHAVAGLQVAVGRFLQEEEHDGEVASISSTHERCDAEAGWQVDACASLQQLPHDLQVAADHGRVQQDLDRQRAGRALCGLAGVRWGGRRGGGSLRRRCVLLDEGYGGRVALKLGALQGGAAVVVEQLGVGLGSQQGLHARLLPFESGTHQGGAAVAVLQVTVGQVLQEDEQDGEVAVGRSSHERGEAEAAWQVDARASLQ